MSRSNAKLRMHKQCWWAGAWQWRQRGQGMLRHSGTATRVARGGEAPAQQVNNFHHFHFPSYTSGASALTWEALVTGGQILWLKGCAVVIVCPHISVWKLSKWKIIRYRMWCNYDTVTVSKIRCMLNHLYQHKPKKTVKHTHTYTNRNSNTNTQTNKKINNPTPSYPHKHPSHTKRINENMADAACWEPGRPHSCGVLAPGRLIMCLGRNRNRPSEQTSRSVLRA